MHCASHSGQCGSTDNTRGDSARASSLTARTSLLAAALGSALDSFCSSGTNSVLRTTSSGSRVQSVITVFDHAAASIAHEALWAACTFTQSTNLQ